MGWYILGKIRAHGVTGLSTILTESVFKIAKLYSFNSFFEQLLWKKKPLVHNKFGLSRACILKQETSWNYLEWAGTVANWYLRSIIRSILYYLTKYGFKGSQVLHVSMAVWECFKQFRKRDLLNCFKANLRNNWKILICFEITQMTFETKCGS